eukprot:CAMPEP_0197447688 /NCGR_PEP_ID=MMETSP1175-20131217/14277_1 /TAXON_ID=1003142 /ORGANISM="Triceratium dubium, Strain CCMP147" /LENGTH=213 /DNA_ID=CAMNT_0042979127 /DNA_START=25 /DNA_END=666 /DNA_ORIENTATION=-
MMKLVVAALLAGSAAAFAPARVGKASTALNSFEDELGAQPPLGFFDPLGLVADGNEQKFARLRFVEIKHGRIAMLAFLGNILPRAGVHFGGDLSYGHPFDSYPNGLAAIYGENAIPQAGWLQIVAFIGWLELFVMKDSANGAEPGEFIGDFRNGPTGIDFGWDMFNDEQKYQKRAIELNNGRAAMMGILGLTVHEKLNEIGMVADLPIIGALK